ncbi:MAG: universal stress protein [Solirubrobacteraceae bacterium]|nr:universal stress protein [Solirubrobacteraceae bacterium]
MLQPGPRARTIVVGVDGRAHDAEAIALAQHLAGPEAELLVASVGVSDRTPHMLGGPVRARSTRDAERAVDAVTEREVHLEGVAITADSIGDGLAQLARGAHADLIVVASSRRGRLGRVLGGDAVHDIVRHAPCRVAVAPVGYPGPEAPLVLRPGAALAPHHTADALDPVPESGPS